MHDDSCTEVHSTMFTKPQPAIQDPFSTLRLCVLSFRKHFPWETSKWENTVAKKKYFFKTCRYSKILLDRRIAQ